MTMYYLDLLLHITPEDRPENLPLTRLQTVRDTGNGTNVIGHREENQLLVDEVVVRDLLQTMIQESSRL